MSSPERPPVPASADAAPVGVGVAAGALPGTTAAPAPQVPAQGGEVRAETAELIALIDRLEALLERSDLTELEVEAAGTAVVLRTPAAIAPAVRAGSAPALVAPAPTAVRAGDERPELEEAASSLHAVLAPLTGLFYHSPSPGAAPYVRVGDGVQVGQVIGLIEAMKLFNEIKSDVAGRVVRFAADDGALVKAKQPLVEVEPG